MPLQNAVNRPTTLAAAGITDGVGTTGNQTLAGTKTFTSSPVIPTPAVTDNSTKAASTAFVVNRSSRYQVHLTHPGAINQTTLNTWTSLVPNLSEVVDTSGIHSGGIITIPQTGIWTVGASLKVEAGAVVTGGGSGLPPCPSPGTPLSYTWSFVQLGYDLGLHLVQESWALVPGTIAYWMAQAHAYDPILYPTLDFGGYETASFSDYGVSYDNLIIDREWPDSQGDQVSLLSQFFLTSSSPTRPSTSNDFNTAYPNAPWRIISVTGANFTSTSLQGFEDDIYCDDGSSGSLITTYPGLSEARIAYKLNSSDGALPLYHTKLAAISPEQHTGLVLGGSFQWVGQLNQNDTLQPQVYVGAASGHFNLSPARFWCHPTY
jgi:hypothetical protein